MQNRANQAVIQSRIKPAVHKRNIQVAVPRTVKVVVQPSVAKTIDLNKVKHSKPIQQTKIADSSRKTIEKQPINQAISKNNNPGKRQLKRTKAGIQYQTRLATPESVAKIKEIRNKGRGKLLAIIGNGPSLSEVPVEQLKGIPGLDIISINRPDPRLWPTSHWAFFDRSQFRRHQDLWNAYEGIMFNSTAIKEQKPKSMQFTNRPGVGFSRDPVEGIFIGYSSVYASLQIAFWMNYDHVYILGCDMNPEGLDGKMHFYGVNPDVEPGLRGQRFQREEKSYAHAATTLSEEERHRVTFCTDYNPWDFVKSFNQISHKTAVEHIRNHASIPPSC